MIILYFLNMAKRQNICPSMRLRDLTTVFESTSKKNASASETRIRRAVFDLIPDTGGDAHRQKGRCVEGRKCGSTQKKLNPGHGGTFASYRRFIGRHSKGQRRSRRILDK